MAFTFATVLNAQVIIVLDKTSREALPGVIVYHPKSGSNETSNAKGTVKSPNNGNYDSLLFNLSGYKSLFLSKSEIESNKK